MKIYDISQEVFGCRVYPGDPAPNGTVLASMERGDPYHLTALELCTHNGTHIDAPFHFIRNGRTVEKLDPRVFVGPAFVTECSGTVSARDAERILKQAKGEASEAAARILIKGEAVVSAEAAQVFAEAKILLLGNESQTVGPEDAPMQVHRILLGADVILLEGIRLGAVSEGVYFLCAAPLNLSGSDGAPCRALLMEFEA